MAYDLRHLSKKERFLGNLLENLEEFLLEYDDVRDKGSLQPRLTKLEEAYDTFCAVRIEMESILEDLDLANDEDNDDDEERTMKKETRNKENKKVFKQFVNRYFVIKQQLMSKMESIPAPPVQRRSSVSDLPCHTKYPELTLPTFSGKLSDWINFRDNFRSLIHDNAQLNEMDKFNYLRTSLKDDALLQINQIQVSAINYGLAWSTLESKYENHKLIAQEHMRALFAAPVMRTESFEGLNSLLTTFKTNLQQLEKLGQKTNSWNTLLAFMLSQKLDAKTYRMWETHHASKTVPSYEAMVVFLETQCTILQSTVSRSENHDQLNLIAPISHSTIASERLCIICRNGRHRAEQCQTFSRMRVIDRKDLVRSMGLCFNCLNSEHFVADCGQHSCEKCGQRHHYLLHPYYSPHLSRSNVQNFYQASRRPQRANSRSYSEPDTQHTQSRMNRNQISQNPQSTQQPPPTNMPSVSHHTTTLLSTQRHTHTAILSTAVVLLVDNSGNKVLARALLDNGSQINMMTENLSKKLKFKRFRESLPVKGVGGSICVSTESVKARIESSTSSYCIAEMKFFVLPRITVDLPQRSFDINTWKLPSSIHLADPMFNESSSVDLVIGVSTFYDLLLAEQMRIIDSGPILQNTQLGWIVAGELPEAPIISYSAISPEVSTDGKSHHLKKLCVLESHQTESSSMKESTYGDVLERTANRGNNEYAISLPHASSVIMLCVYAIVFPISVGNGMSDSRLDWLLRAAVSQNNST
ncbi:uncharacterized protein LOC129743452 [Uranotaenia lowii]|uniref:uncharacterized protein LOC129743452 n=1 Tax=Uranotaenia lowii TaxID=190385 RepID=UPI00247857E9|nr:uncharacterized protein LOC129743452 [Uranotaenia lowii]